MRILIKRLYRLIIAMCQLNWANLFKLYDKKSKNVVWIVDTRLRYLFTTSIIWDLATINSLLRNNHSFRLKLGKKVGGVTESTIFYTLHSSYNIFAFDNYVSIFNYVLPQLEQNGNRLYPNAKQAEFWENKAHMHREFDRLGVPSPRTVIKRIKDIDSNHDSYQYPILLKLIHSYESKGLYKIENLKDLQKIKKILAEKNPDEEVLMQEILNMRRDLRVILVNGNVEHFYWRINLSDTWRPTATSKGNIVDFGNFPENSRNSIENSFKKLNLEIGAFDVAWQNDDLNSEPIILEVSPVFSPNPITSEQYYIENYGDYKKKIAFNGYDFNYVRLIFELKHKHITGSFRN